MDVLSYLPKELSRDQIKKINALTDSTWPESATKSSTEEKVEEFYNRHPNKKCHVVFDRDEVVGYAESWGREITIDDNEMEILALGGVCVNPSHRGLKLGAKLVLEAFKRVDQKAFPLALFQTGVPGFYEKLNCKLIDNKIINSLNEEDPEAFPFWDDYIMIYPNSYPILPGIIDILGKGY